MNAELLVPIVMAAAALLLAVPAVTLLTRGRDGEPVRLGGRVFAQPRHQGGAMLCFAVFGLAWAVDLLLPDHEAAQQGTLVVRLVVLAVGAALMTRIRRPERR